MTRREYIFKKLGSRVASSNSVGAQHAGPSHADDIAVASLLFQDGIDG